MSNLAVSALAKMPLRCPSLLSDGFSDSRNMPTVFDGVRTAFSFFHWLPWRRAMLEYLWSKLCMRCPAPVHTNNTKKKARWRMLEYARETSTN
jgi:hypothetical protein